MSRYVRSADMAAPADERPLRRAQERDNRPSRRGERRTDTRASGFALVSDEDRSSRRSVRSRTADEDRPRRRVEDRSDRSYGRPSSRRASSRMSDERPRRDAARTRDASAERGYAVRSAFYTADDYQADTGHSPRAPWGGSARGAGAAYAGSSAAVAVEERGYDVRSAFYTADDYRGGYRDPRGGRRSARTVRRGASLLGSSVAELGEGMTQTVLQLSVHARGLLIVFLIVFSVVALYAPARELYVANRTIDTLQVTYDALLAENDSIRSELELLQTREGIEDEARARGYVEPGETKVIVEGLPQQEADELPNLAGDVRVPDTRPWYLRLLDTLFRFDPEE